MLGDRTENGVSILIIEAGSFKQKASVCFCVVYQYVSILLIEAGSFKRKLSCSDDGQKVLSFNPLNRGGA